MVQIHCNWTIPKMQATIKLSLSYLLRNHNISVSACKRLKAFISHFKHLITYEKVNSIKKCVTVITKKDSANKIISKISSLI